MLGPSLTPPIIIPLCTPHVHLPCSWKMSIAIPGLKVKQKQRYEFSLLRKTKEEGSTMVATSWLVERLDLEPMLHRLGGFKFLS